MPYDFVNTHCTLRSCEGNFINYMQIYVRQTCVILAFTVLLNVNHASSEKKKRKKNEKVKESK
jgi:hypothetical protein